MPKRVFAWTRFALLFASGCDALLGVTDVPEPADAHLDAAAPEASPCGDTITNRHNCGRCGHDCLGGLCSKSACQPIALVPAGSGVSPYGLAQDDSFLYWTDDNNSKVERTDKTSAATVILTRSTYVPYAIALDDAEMYWGDATGLLRCPKAGCSTEPTLVANEMVALAVSLAVDDANIYWTEGFGFLLRASKSGTNQSPTSLWGGDAGFDGGTNLVAADGRRVYFTASDGLLRSVAVDGSAPSAIGTANPHGSYGVALFDENVYWSEVDPSKGSIDRASTSSSAPERIAFRQRYPGAVATDGTNIYWTATIADADAGTVGAVVGCAVASCVPSTLASGYASLITVVVDKEAIYWTDNGSTSTNGSIWKLAK